MRLIDADALEKELKKDIMGGLNYRWYINNAPTVCDIEQIRAEIYHECCAKYQKTCEIYKKAFGQMRAEVEELKDGFIDNTKVINAVLDIIDKYTK